MPPTRIFRWHFVSARAQLSFPTFNRLDIFLSSIRTIRSVMWLWIRFMFIHYLYSPVISIFVFFWVVASFPESENNHIEPPANVEQKKEFRVSSFLSFGHNVRRTKLHSLRMAFPFILHMSHQYTRVYVCWNMKFVVGGKKTSRKNRLDARDKNIFTW